MNDHESTNVEAAAYLARGEDPLPIGPPIRPTEGDVYFRFGSSTLLAVCLGNGRYAFEWNGLRMIAEPHMAQAFIDWLLRTQDVAA